MCSSVRAPLAAGFASLLLVAAPLAAQTPPAGRIPWPFAPLLGTGRYEIADDTVVQSISYAPRKRFGAAGLGEDGARSLGVELRVPLTVSTYRTDLAGLTSFRLDDVGTFAAIAGVEVDVPSVRRRRSRRRHRSSCASTAPRPGRVYR